MMDIALLPTIDQIDIGLGSSEKGNAIPSAKPRKKTMTSVYLKYFETAADGKSRSCKFCGQNYSIATATGNYLIVFSYSLSLADGDAAKSLHRPLTCAVQNHHFLISL